MARMYWRKRVKKTGINLSWSRKNGLGASLSLGSKNKKGLGWGWNSKSGFRVSLRGTGLYWTFGGSTNNNSKQSFDKDEKIAIKIVQESQKYKDQLAKLISELKTCILQFEQGLDFKNDLVNKAQQTIEYVIKASKETRHLYEKPFTLQASLSSDIEFAQKVFERYLKVVFYDKLNVLFEKYEKNLEANINNMDQLKKDYFTICELNFNQFDMNPNIQTLDKKDLEKTFNKLKIEVQELYLQTMLKLYFSNLLSSINSLYLKATDSLNKAQYLKESNSQIENLRIFLINHSRSKAILIYILEKDQERYLPKNLKEIEELFDLLSKDLVQNLYDEQIEVIFEIINQSLEVSEIQNNALSLNIIENILSLISKIQLEYQMIEEMKLNISLLLKGILNDCRDDLDAFAYENTLNILNFDFEVMNILFTNYYEKIYSPFHDKKTKVYELLNTMENSVQFEIEYLFDDILEVLHFILDKCVEYANIEIANFVIEIQSNNLNTYANIKSEISKKFILVDRVANLCLEIGKKINPHFDESPKSYYDLKKTKLLNKFEFIEDFYLYDKYQSTVSLESLKQDIEAFQDELILVDSFFFKNIKLKIRLNFFQKLFLSKEKKQILLNSKIKQEIENFDRKKLNQHLQSTFLIYKTYYILFLEKRSLLEENNFIMNNLKLTTLLK